MTPTPTPRRSVRHRLLGLLVAAAFPVLALAYLVVPAAWQWHSADAAGGTAAVRVTTAEPAPAPGGGVSPRRCSRS